MAGRLGTVGYPHVTEGGRWTTSADGFWTGGFWIGLCWAGYEERGDGRFRSVAEQALRQFVGRASEPHNHDLGMMFCPSAVKGFRVTGEPRYRQAALQAASALAAQLNEKGGFIPGWGFFGGQDWSGAVLVDTLMSLPLLLWAAAESGEERYRDVAFAHGETSLSCHFREDGSTVHVYRFDPVTGAPIGPGTYQGKSPASCWSRGQAWAIAGCAALARLGAGERYLEAARRTVSYYLDHLPDDRLPFWDFNAAGPGEPRDSSAAAIASYGLLLLGDLLPSFWEAGVACLRALVEAAQAPEGHDAILLHATADLPHGIGVDESTIYGDYFFVRALQYLNNKTAGQPR
ncbi:MAG: glycoside hydrolase family 88 protein [Acidimicrobiales bacterium]